MGDSNITSNVTGNVTSDATGSHVTGILVNFIRGIKSYNGEKPECWIKSVMRRIMCSQQPSLRARASLQHTV